MKISFELKTTWTEELKREWKTLWNKAENANFYNSPMWFDICIQTFNYKNIKIIKCVSENKLVAIMPLYSSREYGIPVFITPLSNGPILFFKKDKYLVNAFLNYLRRLDNVIVFELEETFVKENNLDKVSIRTSQRPYILLEDIKRELSGKSFKKIRTRLRNIGANLTYSSKKAEINDIETIKNIESTSAKVDSSSDIFSAEIIRKLYRNFTKLAASHTFVGFMYDNKKPVVSDFYIIGNNTAHSAHTSFNKEYIAYWPGNLLQFKILEEFIKRGDIKEVDLGRGINSFKMKFATGIRGYNTVYFITNPFKFKYLLVISSLSKYAHHLKEKNKFVFSIVLLIKKIAKKVRK